MLPSKDESVFISFLWSNIIVNSFFFKLFFNLLCNNFYFKKKYTLILVDNYISYKSSSLWNYKLLLLSGVTCVFVVLTSVYFLLRSSHIRSQFHYKMYPINRVAKIDFYMLFTIGVVCYAYPDYLLNGVGDLINYIAIITNFINEK